MRQATPYLSTAPEKRSAMASSSLPRGFSVYQPAIGAPLQFFPPLRTQELDDLISACIPGASSAHEKRASISLDFLEHSQVTGQNFKFYPVHSAPSPAASSPATGSPSLDSVNSSFNVSPVTSSWDWSAASVASSRHSTSSRRPSKTNSPPHVQRNNFAQIPGMKILTKEGLDVTETAVRGTKTKEQRDHAHLMRIIKACDSCRRKKIRCDPSHKKRASQQAVSDAGIAKPARKAKTAKPPAGPKPVAASAETELPSSVLGFDPSFSLDALDSFDATLPYDPLDDFIQFPPMDGSEDLGFLLDSSDFTSSQSSAAASPFKSQTPSSQLEASAPPGEFGNPELQERQSPFSFMDGSVSSGDYTDFNLFSPQSTFSEDERMLPLVSSTASLHPPESRVPGCPQPGSQDFFGVDGIEWYSDGNGALDICTDSGLLNSGTADVQPGQLSVPGAAQVRDQLVINCPPGTVVLGGDGQGQNNVRTPLLSLQFSQRLTSRKVPSSLSVSQSIAQAVLASVRVLRLSSINGAVLTSTQESPGMSTGPTNGIVPSSLSAHYRSVRVPAPFHLKRRHELIWKKGNSASNGSDGLVLSGVSSRTVCGPATICVDPRLTATQESTATDLDRGAATSIAVSASDDQSPGMVCGLDASLLTTAGLTGGKTMERLKDKQQQLHLASAESSSALPGLDQISTGPQTLANTTEPGVRDIPSVLASVESGQTVAANSLQNTQPFNMAQTTMPEGAADETGLDAVASSASSASVRTDVMFVSSGAVSVDSGASAGALATTDRHVVSCTKSGDFLATDVQGSLSAPSITSSDLLALASSVMDAAVLSLVLAASVTTSTFGPVSGRTSSARLSGVSGVVTCRQRLPRQSPSGVHTALPAMVSTCS